MPTINIREDEKHLYDDLDERSERRIKQVTRECAEQLDKLTALVAQVEDRLEPVRLRGPKDHRNETAEPIPGGSPLAMDIASYVDSVKRLQGRLAVLLDELEV